MKISRKKDKEWSDNIKKQASYKCAVIGCTRIATDAHHYKTRRYAANRYGIGFALCWYHHRLIHDQPWKFEIDTDNKTIKEKA
jgi:hypothetical protein